MSKAIRADWAASAPWSGLQGKPAYLLTDGIPVSAIIGLNLPPGTSLAVVAFTGKYSDLIGKPVLGTAAYSNVNDFLRPGMDVSELDNDAEYLSGLQSELYQSGSVDLVMGQTSYAVVFSPPLTGTPEIDLTLWIATAGGAKFYMAVQEDVTDETGFTFELNAAPVASVGKVKWRARVP